MVIEIFRVILFRSLSYHITTEIFRSSTVGIRMSYIYHYNLLFKYKHVNAIIISL